MAWNDIVNDKEFQDQPFETKRKVAENYFQSKVAVGDFLQQPKEVQEKVRTNFMKTIGEDKSFVERYIPEGIMKFSQALTSEPKAGIPVGPDEGRVAAKTVSAAARGVGDTARAATGAAKLLLTDPAVDNNIAFYEKFVRDVKSPEEQEKGRKILAKLYKAKTNNAVMESGLDSVAQNVEEFYKEKGAYNPENLPQGFVEELAYGLVQFAPQMITTYPLSGGGVASGLTKQGLEHLAAKVGPKTAAYIAKFIPQVAIKYGSGFVGGGVYGAVTNQDPLESAKGFAEAEAMFFSLGRMLKYAGNPAKAKISEVMERYRKPEAPKVEPLAKEVTKPTPPTAPTEGVEGTRVASQDVIRKHLDSLTERVKAGDESAVEELHTVVKASMKDKVSGAGNQRSFDFLEKVEGPAPYILSVDVKGLHAVDKLLGQKVGDDYLRALNEVYESEGVDAHRYGEKSDEFLSRHKTAEEAEVTKKKVADKFKKVVLEVPQADGTSRYFTNLEFYAGIGGHSEGKTAHDAAFDRLYEEKRAVQSRPEYQREQLPANLIELTPEEFNSRKKAGWSEVSRAPKEPVVAKEGAVDISLKAYSERPTRLTDKLSYEEWKAEVAPTIPVEKTPTAEAGNLRPAIMQGEKMYEGKEGQQHVDILTENKLKDEGTRGFVTPSGKFLSREEALQWTYKNQPAVAKEVTLREGELHSKEYAEAAGLITPAEKGAVKEELQAKRTEEPTAEVKRKADKATKALDDTFAEDREPTAEELRAIEEAGDVEKSLMEIEEELNRDYNEYVKRGESPVEAKVRARAEEAPTPPRTFIEPPAFKEAIVDKPVEELAKDAKSIVEKMDSIRKALNEGTYSGTEEGAFDKLDALEEQYRLLNKSAEKKQPGAFLRMMRKEPPIAKKGPSEFVVESTKELEYINKAIDIATETGKGFEGMSLDALKKDKALLEKSPSLYFSLRATRLSNDIYLLRKSGASKGDISKVEQARDEMVRISKLAPEEVSTYIESDFTKDELNFVAKYLHDSEYDKLSKDKKDDVLYEASARKDMKLPFNDIGVTTYSGIPVAEGVRAVRDAITYVGKTEAVDGLKRRFAAGTREGAEPSAAILSEQASKAARGQDMFEHGMKNASKLSDKLGKGANIDFMQRADIGAPQRTVELQAISDALDAMWKMKVEEVRKLGTGALQTVRDNYYPHIIKKDTAAARAALGRRPFKGSESFTMKRKYDDIRELMDAGHELASYNFVDLALIKLIEMDRYIVANKTINSLKKVGEIKFFRADQRPPKGEDWTVINDKFSTVWRPIKDDTGAIIGRAIAGHYYAKDATAQVLNNYLSANLYTDKGVGKLFEAYMSVANNLNQFQLGFFSAFHAGFTSFETVISQGALGIKQLSEGRLKDASKSFAKAPVAWINNPRFGDKMIKEWLEPGSQGNEIAQIVDALQAAGGRLHTIKGERFQTNHTKKMLEDWAKGTPTGRIKAIARSPFTVVEQSARPILEWLVPRQKFGVFGELMNDWMQQNPNATHVELRSAARQFWNRTDSRLGQVVYDRIFANNVAKNLVQGLVRAPGWTGGTIIEVGGGIHDTIKLLGDVIEGKPHKVTDRMAYTLSLLMTTALINGALTYAFTGEKPTKDDLWSFRTGRKDDYGKDERFVLPTYAKDIQSYLKRPGTTLMHKMHPVIPLTADLIKNKDDYTNFKIRDEDANLIVQLAQAGGHVVKQFEPFWIRGSRKAQESGKDISATLAPLIGINPATRVMIDTKAWGLIRELAEGDKKRGGYSKDAQEKIETKRERAKQYKEGTLDLADITGKESRELEAEKTEESQFKRATARRSIPEMLRIWKLMTDEEKSKFQDIVLQRIARSRSITADKKDEAFEIVDPTPAKKDGGT